MMVPGLTVPGTGLNMAMIGRIVWKYMEMEKADAERKG